MQDKISLRLIGDFYEITSISLSRVHPEMCSKLNEFYHSGSKKWLIPVSMEKEFVKALEENYFIVKMNNGAVEISQVSDDDEENQNHNRVVKVCEKIEDVQEVLVSQLEYLFIQIEILSLLCNRADRTYIENMYDFGADIKATLEALYRLLSDYLRSIEEG